MKILGVDSEVNNVQKSELNWKSGSLDKYKTWNGTKRGGVITQSRRAKFQRTDNIRCWSGWRATGTLIVAGVSCEMAYLLNYFLRQFEIFVKKKILSMILSHNLAIMPLSIT